MIVLLKLISLYTGACSTSTPSRSQVARSCGCQESILLREYNTKLKQKVKELQQKLNGENSCHYPIKLQMGTFIFSTLLWRNSLQSFHTEPDSEKSVFLLFLLFYRWLIQLDFLASISSKTMCKPKKRRSTWTVFFEEIEGHIQNIQAIFTQTKIYLGIQSMHFVVTPQKQEMPSYSFDYRGRFDFFFSQPSQ